MELLKKNPTLAYAAEEIISELRARLPLVFRGGRSVAHVGDVQGALDELVKAGVLTAESDGTAEHYYFQPRTSTATTKR
ncbi:MAG: hypothetical protein IPH07_15660 [Deltaproteobacteria bacterium]|nr:hypothetical protein [Deltaproteobacteria bacterium]MBK8239216.1 hypothetical protein [Deltaproteobacteria bacterium]MBK8719714.1 hypothetical protein [Deltaproteobacteria bacterium]MBP7288672.1 hypothetical protein [Nannocystaceae bacterium]